MAEALEEWATPEVVDCEVAIEGLQNEMYKLEATNRQLLEEIASLCLAQKDLDELKSKVESLNMALEGSKVAE